MNRHRELQVVQVDVFTDVRYEGNPAAVVLGADRMSAETMTKIAREMNVRETVFVSKSRVGDFRLRYMTPKGEIEFSGHPTIAAFHVLVEEGLVEVVNEVTLFNLETNSGLLPVEIVKNVATGVHEVQITHKQPEFLASYDPKDYAKALGLSLADIMSPHPVETVSTGTPYLMIPLSSQKSLDSISPDWQSLVELCEKGNFVGLCVFTRDVREPTSDAQARVFIPALGVPEDPVSGAPAGCLGSYMIRHGLMAPTYPVTSIVIEQGHYMERPGKVFVEVKGDTEGIEQVKVSGVGVTVMKGTLYV